jgi:hypothetical protein
MKAFLCECAVCDFDGRLLARFSLIKSPFPSFFSKLIFLACRQEESSLFLTKIRIIKRSKHLRTTG